MQRLFHVGWSIVGFAGIKWGSFCKERGLSREHMVCVSCHRAGYVRLGVNSCARSTWLQACVSTLSRSKVAFATILSGPAKVRRAGHRSTSRDGQSLFVYGSAVFLCGSDWFQFRGGWALCDWVKESKLELEFVHGMELEAAVAFIKLEQRADYIYFRAFFSFFAWRSDPEGREAENSL